MNGKRIFILTTLAALFVFATTPTALAAKEIKTICLVVDSQPEVLTQEQKAVIEQNLCTANGFELVTGDTAANLSGVLLYSIGAKQYDVLKQDLDLKKADRLIYSLHSRSDDLIIHRSFAYDKEKNDVFHGGQTFDKGAKVKNADGAWAKAAGVEAENAVWIERMATDIAYVGGILGAQIAAMMRQKEEPWQFLKVRDGYDSEEQQVIRQILVLSPADIPKVVKHYARGCLEYLVGPTNDRQARSAFEQWNQGVPDTSADILRVNLALGMHDYKTALVTAEKADARLGYELFLLSRAIARQQAGETDKAKSLFARFTKRNADNWEEAVLKWAKAAAVAKDEENLKIIGALFLGADPSPVGKAAVEGLLAKSGAK
ncbi:MAG: hypothetical protein H6684_05685 [Deltaproteobacteria bacterium]|nr:hypothetical protein [Deltaproteobacteria bacterium]